MSQTLFEDFSNEILLDFFEYFSTIELFRIWTKLNIRFDKLVSRSFHRHQFDFRCFSSEEIDEFLQNETLSIKSLVIAPNGDYSFPFLDWINERIFSQLNQLTRLHLIDLRDSTSIRSIGFQLANLPQLIDLKFERCFFPLDEDEFLLLIDQIWSCQRLKSCLLNISRRFHAEFLSPRVRSTSIRSIILSEISINSHQLSNLFLQTSELQCFHWYSEQLFNTFDRLPQQINLTKLVLNISIRDEQVIRLILENQQNLRELFVDLHGFGLNGNQWKSIIESSLIKLEKFDFREEIAIETDENEEEIFNEYFQTFNDEFWIEKHRWFVQCQLILTDMFWILSICTIPYRFSSMIVDDSFICRTTSSSSIVEHKNIRYLSVQGNEIDLSTFVELYPHLVSLEIRSPFDRFSLSMFNSFRYLKSLQISLTSTPTRPISSSRISLEMFKICQTDLSIIFDYFNEEEKHRIKFLNLQNNSKSIENDDEIDSLIRLCSQFQCEILALDIRDSTNIRRLIDKSSSIQRLLLHCEDDLYYSENRDDQHFLRFLQGHLPIGTRIFRDFNSPEQIHVFLPNR